MRLCLYGESKRSSIAKVQTSNYVYGVKYETILRLAGFNGLIKPLAMITDQGKLVRDRSLVGFYVSKRRYESRLGLRK
jgi:hypothetical protein